MRMKVRLLSCLVAAAMSFGGFALAGEKAAGDPYMLGTDAVTGEKLGKEPVVVQHNGRELRFANNANAATFKADPKGYLAKLDKQLIEQQAPFYPNKVCAATGEALGGMGETINVIHNNRLVRLCCAGCKDELDTNAAGVFKKLDEAAIKAQAGSYPLTTCVVAGGKLGSMGETVNLVVGNRLVKFCCAGCVAEFKADPAAYLKKIDDAKK